MLGSAGSIVPKRWVLGIFALGLIAVMVATSATQWAGAATVPTSVTASAVSATSIKVDWTAVDSGSTVPAGGVVDSYNVSCAPTSGSPVSTTVSGIGTATATLTGLTASTSYTCSVAAVATGSTPGSAVSASAVTTPADLSKQLGSIVVSPTSGRVQENTGSLGISVAAKGADSSKTAITTGLTVTWSVSGNGSLSTTSGSATTFTAGASGTDTVSVTVSQSSTGISKSTNVSIEVFAVTPDPEPVTPVDPPAVEIPEPPSLGGETQASTAVLTPTTAAAVSIPKPAVDDADFENETSASLDIPAGAVPTGTALALVAELVPSTGGTSVVPTQLIEEDFVPLPADVTPIAAAPLTVQFVDNSGNEVTGVSLESSVTVSMVVPISTILDSGLDAPQVALFKAKDPVLGPWNEVTTGFEITPAGFKFSGQVRDFSTFKLGAKTRELGVPGTPGAGPILPSAGDVAPTTTQALLLTGLGIMLVAGGGLYVRRQRRAGAGR